MYEMSTPIRSLKTGLKQKSDLHVSRKIWHCFGICIMAVIYNFATIRTSWIIVLSICAILIPIDILRLRRPGLNKAIVRLFSRVMRNNESEAISGMTYLFLGAAFLLIMNQKHVVTLTLLFVAFGDPVASFFGIRFGKDRILGNKTLQGTMAAFVLCTTISALYYYFNNIMTERLLIVAPLSGLIGALAELLPIGKLDDNFSFPVLGSILLYLLFTVYGGFGI
jgi:diacylglycerol kinase (CTP)